MLGRVLSRLRRAFRHVDQVHHKAKETFELTSRLHEKVNSRLLELASNPTFHVQEILQETQQLKVLSTQALDKAKSNWDEAYKAAFSSKGANVKIDQAYDAAQQAHAAAKAADDAIKKALDIIASPNRTPDTIKKALDEVIATTQASQEAANQSMKLNAIAGIALTSPHSEEQTSTLHELATATLDTVEMGLEVGEAVTTLGLSIPINRATDAAIDYTLEKTTPIVIPLAQEVINLGNNLKNKAQPIIDTAAKQLDKTVGEKLEKAFNYPKDVAHQVSNHPHQPNLTPW